MAQDPVTANELSPEKVALGILLKRGHHALHRPREQHVVGIKDPEERAGRGLHAGL